MSSRRVIEVEAALEFGRAAWEADKIEVLKASKTATPFISQKEGELNAARAALAAAQAQALADVVAAQIAAEAEMVVVCAKAEEAVTVV